MSDPIAVFDRRLLRRRRQRAAATLPGHDFLFVEVAERLVDRLHDIRRTFPVALDIGCHTGVLRRRLAPEGRVETLIQADLASAMVAAAGGLGVVADEEMLPFGAASFDLVLSCCSLHWVNDLPGALLQLRETLRPDGLLLAAMLGGTTLHELRQSWLAAEAALEGGAGPHVSPFADLRDAAGLLQRAGFTLPVGDTDTITVTYANALALMADLRAMGEGNAQQARRRTPTRRTTLLAAAAHYAERFAEPDGRIRATFEVLYLTGWAPHASQQQPARRGSASRRLADVLGATERPTGERAGPAAG